MRAPRIRVTAFALALAAAVTAGCGQKPGVSEMYAGGQFGSAADGMAGPAAGDALGGQGPAGPGGAADLGGAGAAPGGAAAGPSGGGAGAGGGTSSRSGGGAPPPRTAAKGGGDTTGVTDTSIKVGLHAPVTGAAAVPQTSFQRAVKVYFDSVNAKGGINGRKVEIVFRDDHFDPNTARTECKELAEQEKVFLLIGGAGADQIDACARYAAATGVPYLSGGVHETRPGLGSLGALPTYFAASLTYEQQVPLLARLLGSEFRGKEWGLVVADNDSLNSFYDRALAAGSKVSGEPALARRIPKKTEADAPAIATAICTSGADVVMWNGSPSSFLNVTKSMGCTVTFIGPGLTNGLNIVTSAGCPNIAGSMFYSPMPGMDVMRRNQEFVTAYRQSAGAEPDDIGAAMYGLTKTVGLMLQATGRNLDRESFMSTIARVRSFNSGVFPATNYSSRFGGTAMHLLQADCGSREWVTKRMNERP